MADLRGATADRDLAHLPHAYRYARGHNSDKPLTSLDLERFLPWNAAHESLRAWAEQPAPS